MVQNIVEKRTLQHLLKCILHDLSPQEAAESGLARGLVGLDKNIMKYGLVHRRAKTAYKKDERFLIVVAGKLLLFKNMDIVGAHVRFVTSLFHATTRLVYGQLEFEVMVPDTKSLNFLTLSAEELTAWIGAIDRSATMANEDALASSGLNSQRAMKRQSEDRKRDFGFGDDQDSRYDVKGKGGFSPRYSNTRDHSAARARDGSDELSRQGYEGKYDGDYRRGSRYQPRDEDKGSGKQARSRDHRNDITDGNKGNNVETTGNPHGVTGISQNHSRREVDRPTGSVSGHDKDKALMSRKMRRDDREGHRVSGYGETETDFYCSKQNYEASSSVGKLDAAPFHRKSDVSQSKQKALDETQFGMPRSHTMVNNNEETQEAKYISGDFDDNRHRNNFSRHKERESRIESNNYPRDDRVDAYETPNYARGKNELAQLGGVASGVRHADRIGFDDGSSSEAHKRIDMDKFGANRASLSRNLSQNLDRQISLREPADNQHMKERDLKEESVSVSNLRRESWWPKRQMRDTSTQT